MKSVLAGMWSLVGPSAIILTLLLIGTILFYTGQPKIGRRLCVLGTVCLFVITFLPLDSWALRPLEQRFSLPDLPAKVNGIIVLGGSFDDSIIDLRGAPALYDSAARMVEFARLARLYPDAKLVFTGGSLQPPGKPTEADGARYFMQDVGIDISRVTFERESRNTYQNVFLSKQLVNPKLDETWLLVTSAVHMPRSVGTFRHQNWTVIAVPAGYKASTRYTINLAEHLKRLDDAIHEWQGLIAYRLEGRTDTWFPAP